MNEWGVWCEIYGGVTGHREAWLKCNGEVMRFPDQATAEAEAKRLREAGFGRYNSATFNYYAQRMA